VGESPSRLVWSPDIVVDPPSFDDPAGFSETCEQMFVKAFVAQSAIEGLDEAVLRRPTRRDVVPFDAMFLLPAEYGAWVSSVPLSLRIMCQTASCRRNFLPQASASDTKSKDQRWFSPCGSQEARGFDQVRVDGLACAIAGGGNAVADEPAYMRKLREYAKGDLDSSHLTAFEDELFGASARATAILYSTLVEMRWCVSSPNICVPT
jgi:hypothetical protein